MRTASKHSVFTTRSTGRALTRYSWQSHFLETHICSRTQPTFSFRPGGLFAECEPIALRKRTEWLKTLLPTARKVSISLPQIRLSLMFGYAGELEGTMMRTLCSMATLLTRIIDQTLPEDLRFLNPLLRNDSNGFLASVSPYDFSLETRAVEGSDWTIPRGHPELISRDSPEHKILQEAQIPYEEPWYVLRCDKITRAGRTFRTENASQPDATVQFHNLSSSISSGVIQTMFVLFKAHRNGYTAQKVYVTIRRHVPLIPVDKVEDPFKKYPDLGVWVVKEKLEPTSELVAADAIVSHVATCRYMMASMAQGGGCIPCLGILPLDSVSFTAPHQVPKLTKYITAPADVAKSVSDSEIWSRRFFDSIDREVLYHNQTRNLFRDSLITNLRSTGWSRDRVGSSPERYGIRAFTSPAGRGYR